MRASGTPFPLRWQTQFSYFQQENTSASFSAHRWIINSIYDPDSSGVGGQPRFFGILLGASGILSTNVQPYRAFRVNACKIEVEIFNAQGPNGVIATINLHRNSAEGPATIYEARTRLNSVSQMLSGTSTVTKLEMYAKMKTLFGVKDLDDASYNGGYSANPARDYYATVSVGSLDGVTATDCTITTKLVYYVDLLDRNTETYSPSV